jgi:hypothetical protein
MFSGRLCSGLRIGGKIHFIRAAGRQLAVQAGKPGRENGGIETFPRN